MPQWNFSPTATCLHIPPCRPVHIPPRLPEDPHWLLGVFLPPFPSPTPPLPHPHTHPSSHPQGTYLSVTFIHNPCDLNLFPPHRPRLFISLFFLKNLMLSSLCSFFFFLVTPSFICLFSAFYLFQSTQRFQHPYLQEEGNGEGGGEDED